MEQTESTEETILYELLVYSEWGPEQETAGKSNEAGFLWKNLSNILGCKTGASYVAEWTSQQLRWQLAIGAEGKAVAILQDNNLEIRTSRDKYSATIGKTNITKDNFPKWRKAEWSPDGTLLAVAHSNGVIDVYDLLASHLFQIPASTSGSKLSQERYPESAVSGLIFTDARTKNTHWPWELISIDYAGSLRAYFVSPMQGFEPSHVFSFSSQLPLGITAVSGDSARHLLVVATPTSFSPEVQHINCQNLTGDNFGLKVWRMLDERPFYAEVPIAANIVSKRWLQSFRKRSYANTIAKLSISPDGTCVAAIHSSGTISLWTMPTLRCLSIWPLDRQPGYDELNSKLLQLPAHRRVRSPTYLNPLKHHPIDLNWWSEDSIIVARVSGAVVIYNVKDMFNKLGSSAEFFEGSPRISSAFNGTFLGLECEVKVQKKRLQAALNNTATSSVFDADQVEEDVEELSEEEESGSYLVPGVARSLLYWATDSERFQPPRKKPKLISKTYRLLGFKKTTPEELYKWKLDAEEYGEALALARAYGLDCDLVYQRQWRNAPASVETIHDYLSKVSKRDWVLRECLGRVPEDVDAVRELLTYGLQNTDASVVAGGTIADVTKWKSLDYGETEEELRQKEETHRRKWLAKIDFSNLTVEQKMLISTRRRLLQYLDRLAIYEVILGGAHLAAERFSSSFFEKFRSQTALESTIDFAHQGDWQAVAIMFTYHGTQTLPHRLAVCSCLPETLAPFEYRSVLPECDINGDVYLWEQQNVRKPDWSESPVVRMAIDTELAIENEYVETFYEEEPKLKPFRSPGVELNTHTVSEWYQFRSADIEKQSMLIENAVDLIKLGLERNVPSLERIHHQLLTLETIVYDLSYDHLNLEKLSAMSELAVCQLIMSRCDNETFLPTLNRWLMPYLRRIDTLRPGSISELLRNLLAARSQEDLSWILQICSNAKTESHLISEPMLLISLALDCLYACQKPDQLEIAMKVYDCLPERPNSSHTDPQLNELHDKLDALQTHLEAADILSNYGVPMTPSMIAAKQNDADQIEQLFVRLTRTVLRNQNDNEWKDLNQDMIELHKKVFGLITPQACHEILVGSMLSSAKKSAIKAAGALLQIDPDNRKSSSSIPFERSKKLILEAAEEYFNSSENFADPSLELANYCLALVVVKDDQIQQAKDLISAVQLLHEYGLDMPPLKIRLSRNRFVFIDQVLKYAGKAYKNSSRLVRLGQLLRACENDKVLEGEVFIRIAETAINKQDFDVAGHICNKIRLANYAAGWEVCTRLANLDDISDLNIKMELVSFAMVYCPPENIEELLLLRWNLEKKLLRDKCSKQLESYVTYENGDESLLTVLDQTAVETYKREAAKNKLHQIVQKPVKNTDKGKIPKQVLQTTADTTKHIVSAVKATLNLNETENKTIVGKSEKANKDCNQWAAPAFYFDAFRISGRKLHESILEASYRIYSLPEVTQSELKLLTWSWRTQVLEAMQKPLFSGNCMRDDILSKLSEFQFSEDCLLALGHLLDLEKGDRAWDPLTRLPSTEITLQIAAYYFALRMASLSEANLDFISISPRRLIDKCALLNKSTLSEEQKTYYNLLNRSLRLLSDVSEAQQLRRLDSGVDINRFTTDDAYKHDTIVGLAITSDSNIYSAAVRLAKHYGVEQWEVTFSHLTALFTNEAVAPSRIRQLMDEHRMGEILLKDKAAFGRKMLDIVYPNISGRDHERLALFFDIIKSDPTTNDMMNPAADVFAKLLKKLSSLKGIDLKEITKSSNSFVKEIGRTVNAETAGKLAKLAQQLSSLIEPLKSKISPGMVHLIWARKYFFELISEQKNPSDADWYYRFESCKPHISKLSAGEVLDLIDGLCFSDQSLDLLTLDVRAEVASRFLKLLKDRKNTKDASLDDCLKRLENWVGHLNRLRQDYYHEIRTEVMSSVGAEFWREFEQSKAEEASLYRLLIRILIERHPVSMVQLFIGAFPPTFSSTPEDVLENAVRLTLEHLRRSSTTSTEDWEDTLQNLDLFENCDAIKVLLHILTEVHHFVENNEDSIGLLNVSDVEETVQLFCVDETVDVDVRLQLLLMLQSIPGRFSAFSEGSGRRVQWLRTLAIIKQTWCTDSEDKTTAFSEFIGDLREDDLKNEEERNELFNRLLNRSTTNFHLNSLAKLLNCWPPSDMKRDFRSIPWILLWEKLTQLSSFAADGLVFDSLKLALEHQEKHHSIPEEGILYMDDTLKKLSQFDESMTNCCIRLRLHIALRSSIPQLVDDMLTLINIKPDLTQDSYDAEILDLVLERGLVGKLADTPLYAPLCERLLSLPPTLPSSPSSVESVAHQLIEHGHRSEAGHLLQLTRGLPRYLMNFTSSLYFARRQAK